MDRNKKQFWIGVTISYLVLFATVLILGLFPATIVVGMQWNWGLAMFLALVLYTIASLRQIGPTEIGARIFLGKPIDNVSSGFVFVPLFVFKLGKETKLIIQNEFPGEPKDIYREPKDGGDGIIPPGKVPPIRIPFGNPGEQTCFVLECDPLNQRLIEEVSPVVRWRINDYVKFLTTIGDRDSAERQMEDLCVATLSREFGKVTPAQVIEDYPKYNKTLTDEINDAIETWGITVESARVKVINFSRDLNKAVQTIAEETAKGKAEVIKAEGLKKSAILAGEGAGGAEKAVLEGRTAGLKKMAEDLGLSGEMILAAETARAITSNPGQKTIIAGSSGFSELATIGSVLGETLKTGKEG